MLHTERCSGYRNVELNPNTKSSIQIQSNPFEYFLLKLYLGIGIKFNLGLFSSRNSTGDKKPQI